HVGVHRVAVVQGEDWRLADGRRLRMEPLDGDVQAVEGGGEERRIEVTRGDVASGGNNTRRRMHFGSRGAGVQGRRIDADHLAGAHEDSSVRDVDGPVLADQYARRSDQPFARDGRARAVRSNTDQRAIAREERTRGMLQDIEAAIGTEVDVDDGFEPCVHDLRRLTGNDAIDVGGASGEGDAGQLADVV